MQDPVAVEDQVAVQERQRTRPRARVEVWQASLGLIAGAIGSQVVGAIPFVIAIVLMIGEQGMAIDPAAMQQDLISSFGVLGPSILLTGATMAFFAWGTVLLAGARPVGAALGFRKAPWPTFVVAPIGILALGPLSDVLHRMMQTYAPSLTFGALEGLDQVAKSAPIYLVVPAMALVPGFCEELLFRGLFQRSIRTRWLAVVLSALLFAGIHMDPHHVVAIVPLGFYLAWLADRTDSVLVPMVAHVANNAAAVVGARMLGAEEPTILTWLSLPDTLEWLYLPIGLAVAAACVAVVLWSTRKKPDAALPPSPALVDVPSSTSL